MKGTEQITGERDSQMGSERDGARLFWLRATSAAFWLAACFLVILFFCWAK